MILKDLKARLEPPLSFSLEFAPSTAAVPCLFPWTALLYSFPYHPCSSVFQFSNTPMGKVKRRDKKSSGSGRPLIPRRFLPAMKFPERFPAATSGYIRYPHRLFVPHIPESRCTASLPAGSSSPLLPGCNGRSAVRRYSSVSAGSLLKCSRSDCPGRPSCCTGTHTGSRSDGI